MADSTPPVSPMAAAMAADEALAGMADLDLGELAAATAGQEAGGEGAGMSTAEREDEEELVRQLSNADAEDEEDDDEDEDIDDDDEEDEEERKLRTAERMGGMGSSMGDGGEDMSSELRALDAAVEAGDVRALIDLERVLERVELCLAFGSSAQRHALVSLLTDSAGTLCPARFTHPLH